MDGFDSCIGSKSCTIFSSGIVTCILPCEHLAYCNGNLDGYLDDWPFDNQKCQFILTSRSYDVNQLVINVEDIKIEGESGLVNPEWKLLLTSYLIDDPIYENAIKIRKSVLLLNFRMERHRQRFVCLIIIPAIVLAVFNILFLLLSPETPERVILYVINLMSHMANLEIIYWT